MFCWPVGFVAIFFICFETTFGGGPGLTPASLLRVIPGGGVWGIYFCTRRYQN